MRFDIIAVAVILLIVMPAQSFDYEKPQTIDNTKYVYGNETMEGIYAIKERIYIMPGGHLTIKNSYLTFWKEPYTYFTYIKVHEGGTLSLYNTTIIMFGDYRHGYIEVRGNMTADKCSFAVSGAYPPHLYIYALENSNLSIINSNFGYENDFTQNVQILIDDCENFELRKCKFYVELRESPIIVANNGRNAVIEKCLFNMKRVYYNYPMMISLSIKTVLLTDCNFIGGSHISGVKISQSYNAIIKMNVFTGLRLGLEMAAEAYGSNQVKDSDFRGITHFIKNNIFENCRVAMSIYLESDVSISSNLFRDCAVGINGIIKYSDVEILSNSFANISKHGISYGISYAEYGGKILVESNTFVNYFKEYTGKAIILKEIRNINVKENNIFNFYSGILCEGCGGSVEENTFFNCTQAIIAKDSIHMKQTSELHLRKNIIQRSKNGIDAYSLVHSPSKEASIIIENNEIEAFNEGINLYVNIYIMQDWDSQSSGNISLISNTIHGATVGVIVNLYYVQQLVHNILNINIYENNIFNCTTGILINSGDTGAVPEIYINITRNNIFSCKIGIDSIMDSPFLNVLITISKNQIVNGDIGIHIVSPIHTASSEDMDDLDMWYLYVYSIVDNNISKCEWGITCEKFLGISATQNFMATINSVNNINDCFYGKICRIVYINVEIKGKARDDATVILMDDSKKFNFNFRTNFTGHALDSYGSIPKVPDFYITDDDELIRIFNYNIVAHKIYNGVGKSNVTMDDKYDYYVSIYLRPMPDIAIRNFIISNEFPNENESIEVKFEIVNSQKYTYTHFRVYALTGEFVYGDKIVPISVFVIQPNASVSMKYEIKLPPGKHVIKVIITNFTWGISPKHEDPFPENNYVCRTIEVNGLPHPYLSANKTSIMSGDIVEFDAEASWDDGDIIYYAFDFGDGTPPIWTKASKISHIYRRPGIYNATVRVMDSHGTISAEFTPLVIYVANRAPTLNLVLTSHQAIGSNEYVVVTADAKDYDGKITGFYWEFGDGDYEYGEKLHTVSHKYISPGRYIITCKVYDDYGDYTIEQISVVVMNLRPIASFFTSPSDIKSNSPVTFHANAYDPDGRVMMYHWEFGDGSMSSLPDPTHIYDDDGVYDVKLIVIDNCGEESEVYVKKIYVGNVPPVANIVIKSMDNGKIILGSEGSYDVDDNIEKCVWDFGDGTVYEGADAVHTYEKEGLYTILLRVYDDDGDYGEAYLKADVKIRTEKKEWTIQGGIILPVIGLFMCALLVYIRREQIIKVGKGILSKIRKEEKEKKRVKKSVKKLPRESIYELKLKKYRAIARVKDRRYMREGPEKSIGYSYLIRVRNQ